MTTSKREILADVAAGRITPEEADRLLTELEGPAEPTPVLEEPAAAGLPPSGLRLVRINCAAGSVEVTADPSVQEAVADGEHTARREGDTLFIEHADEELGFHFGRAGIFWGTDKK